jgi:hypothetical protein
MEQQYLIKNTEDSKYFSISVLDLKTDDGDIDFTDLGEATPLTSAQADEFLSHFKELNNELKLIKEELSPDLAKIMTNNFDIGKIFNKEEMERLNPALAEGFKEKILKMYETCVAVQPGFNKMPIEAAVSNLLNVGLSQISDPRYTSYSKRLGKLIDNNKNGTKYFKIYSLLIELGITSLIKDISGA